MDGLIADPVRYMSVCPYPTTTAGLAGPAGLVAVAAPAGVSAASPGGPGGARWDLTWPLSVRPAGRPRMTWASGAQGLYDDLVRATSMLLTCIKTN